jgi:hypothetical protein
MAQWQQVQSLGCTHNEINNRVVHLYRAAGIPVEVRHFLCATIEDPRWNLLGDMASDLNDQQKRNLSVELLTALIEELQFRLEREQNIVEHSKWQDHIDRLKERFSQAHSPLLYEELGKCLKEEKEILARSNKHFEKQSTSTSPNKHYDSQALKKSIRKNCELVMQIINKMNLDTLKAIEHKYVELPDVLELQVHDCSEKNSISKSSRSLKQDLEEYIEEMNDNIMHPLSARVIGPLWQLIMNWTMETKDSYISSKPKSVTVEELDHLCQLANECYRYVLRLLKFLIENFQCLQNDAKFKGYLAELEGLFPKHLERIFIVCEEPERIVNVSKDRTNSFHLSLCILGGAGLGSFWNSGINVELQAYQEKDLKNVSEGNGIPHSIWSVTNNTGMFEAGKNILKMEEISVRDIATATRRRHTGEPRGQKKTLAAEEKNLIVAFAKIIVDDKEYDIKAYTLPMMFITQPSQNWTAKGALVWYSAFSDKFNTIGIPVSEWIEVKAIEVKHMLRNVFFKFTGENLTDEHLDYLVRWLLKVKDQDTDISKLVIKRDKFLKTNNGAKFSFWKWFLACINLVENKLKYEWKQGLIYGFCDKKRADQLLRSRNPQKGSFLLRFSESAIENSASSTYSANLTVCVLETPPYLNGQDKLQSYHINKHLRGEDLVNRNLISVVRGMEIEDPTWNGGRRQLLRYLYPDNKPVEEVFSTKCDPDPDPDHYQDCYVGDNAIEEKFLIKLWPDNQGPGMFPIDESPPPSVESVQSNQPDLLPDTVQTIPQGNWGMPYSQYQPPCMSPPGTTWDQPAYPIKVPSPPQNGVSAIQSSPPQPGMQQMQPSTSATYPPVYMQPSLQSGIPISSPASPAEMSGLPTQIPNSMMTSPDHCSIACPRYLIEPASPDELPFLTTEEVATQLEMTKMQ